MSTNDTNPADEVKTESQLAEELRQAKEDEGTKPEPPAPKVDDEQIVPEVVDPADVVQPESTTPQQPEKDLDWYKKAYEESTKEALRLKAIADAKPPETPAVETPTPSGLELYVKQQQDKEIADAFAEITKNYPQASEPAEYEKFTKMANTFGKTILDAENRLATPAELYSKTVIALGWTADDDKDRLNSALKGSASAPRVSSGGASAPSSSKVTDAMIIANRKMYPGKSDSEIREELEPHVQV